ncbi:MAG: hypothetical protein WCF85_04885 [Rhodospirillaceae bacterium]
MGRVFSLLALMAVAACGTETNRLPYVWPDPGDVVPWNSTAFTVRYSEWWNTEAELQATIAELCGPKFTVARLSSPRRDGSAMHPFSVSVKCGSAPVPKPQFRGQAVDVGRIISLKPGVVPSP